MKIAAKGLASRVYVTILAKIINDRHMLSGNDFCHLRLSI